MPILDSEATEIYRRFQQGQTFLQRKGLTKLIPMCVDFYEGRQWAAVTENTRHIPRPVLNFIAKIVSNKQSNILGSPVHLNFRADSDEDSTEKFTKFAEFQMKEMQQDHYDAIACLDGLVKGTYVYYYYWDETAVGNRGNNEGSLRCEVLDPLDVVVSNPLETNTQKQEWIIIRSREPVKAVRELYGNKKKGADEIVPDSYTTDYNEMYEQDGSDFVTVYTRFFRQDGEVYFEKATRDVLIHKPIPMNPYLTAELIKKREKEDNKGLNNPEQFDVDPQKPTNTDSEPQEENEKDYLDNLYKFSKYPIVIGSLTPADRCIYGISEVAGQIENQKAVNFQYSMILLNSQSLGWGKWMIKKDALKGQKITNQPGQVLVDHTPIGSWGVQQVAGQQFSNGSFEVANQIIEMARAVTNSSDVITGDMVSKDLSGTAIAQIQAQGQKPIEQMQKLFWRSKEEIGGILEEFYKLYYEETEYSYEINDAEYQRREEDMQRLAMDRGEPNVKLPNISRTATGYFNGEDFMKTPFNIVCEAGKGTQYSEIMQMDFANNLILNGNIDKISPENLELLIDLYPQSAIANKADIKRFLRKKENSMINQLQGKLQQATQLLQQCQQAMQQKDGQISALNQYLKAYQQEAGKQLDLAYKKNADMTKFMKNTKLQSEQPSEDTSSSK